MNLPNEIEPVLKSSAVFLLVVLCRSSNCTILTFSLTFRPSVTLCLPVHPCDVMEDRKYRSGGICPKNVFGNS
jgi:hypothetical protein